VSTIEELADAAVYFYRPLEPTAELRTQHYSAEAIAALSALATRLEAIEWSRPAIGAAVKAVADEHKLKMPKIAMPLRVMVTGETQTPSIDATLELIGRDESLARMRRELAQAASL
jgi:glutamyl-tRNA synthetase